MPGHLQILCFNLILAQLCASFIYIDKYTICNEQSNMIKTNVTLKRDAQNFSLLDIDAKVPVPIGDNVRVILNLKVNTNGKWVGLFDRNDNNFCVFGRRFGGALYEDLLRALSIPPAQCPIRQGEYHTKDFKVNTDKLGYKIFPRGMFKISGKAFLKRDDKEIYCGELIARNA